MPIFTKSTLSRRTVSIMSFLFGRKDSQKVPLAVDLNGRSEFAGFLVCSNSLQSGVAIRMNFFVVCVLGARGHPKITKLVVERIAVFVVYVIRRVVICHNLPNYAMNIKTSIGYPNVASSVSVSASSRFRGKPLIPSSLRSGICEMFDRPDLPKQHAYLWVIIEAFQKMFPIGQPCSLHIANPLYCEPLAHDNVWISECQQTRGAQ